MFQASYGDTILVTAGTTEKGFSNILIDCGYNYHLGILPRLKKLLKEQTISRFIITHYDSDHIKNAGSFLKDNGLNENPQIAKIEQIWLNTFRHLQFSKREKVDLTKDQKREINELLHDISSSIKKENNIGNIGAQQASLLGKAILAGNYQWNTDTNGEAVCLENLKDVSIDTNIKLHLLSPAKKRLENLEMEFVTKLSKLGLYPNNDEIFDDAFELLNLSNYKNTSSQGNIASVKKTVNSNTIKLFSQGKNYLKDDRIGNGSSISFIFEAENKKVLFLADAFAEDIIEELKDKYPDNSNYPIFFDAVKISHHGSFRNNSPELFKIVDSDIFLFSTNGKHPTHTHPDVETISCIINRDLPAKVKSRTLVFNYVLEHLKDFSSDELKAEFKYDIKIQSETLI